MQITIGNIGDSSAYYFIVDENKKVIAHALLNTRHQPKEEKERARIWESGGLIHRGRLNSELAVSRALGDIRHDGMGISHVPDVTFFSFPLKQGQSAWVVVTSDGADPIQQKMVELIEKYCERSPSGMASMLVGAAADHARRRDNISIAVLPVNRTLASIAVFDGHGGRAVASEVSQHFYPTLQGEIRLLCKKEPLRKSRQVKSEGGAYSRVSVISG